MSYSRRAVPRAILMVAGILAGSMLVTDFVRRLDVTVHAESPASITIVLHAFTASAGCGP